MSECVVTPSPKHTMRQFLSYSDNDTDDKKINCHRAQDDFLFLWQITLILSQLCPMPNKKREKYHQK